MNVTRLRHFLEEWVVVDACDYSKFTRDLKAIFESTEECCKCHCLVFESDIQEWSGDKYCANCLKGFFDESVI